MKKKRILLKMSVPLFNQGHISLLQKISQYGEVIVGLIKEQQFFQEKGYIPELSFENQKQILQSIHFVKEVIETPLKVDKNFLSKHSIDLVINETNLDPSKTLFLDLKEYDIDSLSLREKAVRSFFNQKNYEKPMYTPGPTCIIDEAIIGIRPVFGRGDDEYEKIEQAVLQELKEISGQDNIIRMQGSATLGLETAIKNFVRGKVLVVLVGYYSERLKTIINHSELPIDMDTISYQDLNKINSKYDWFLTVYTETAEAFKVDLSIIKNRASHCNAKLFIDATGSIGLEEHHHLADVSVFSSCKGLFGLVGASFISFNNDVEKFKTNSFYLDLELQKQGGVTGPFHTICSLYQVLPKLETFRHQVKLSKKRFMEKYKKYLTVEDLFQPLLCTHISKKLTKTDFPENSILYNPRSCNKEGTIVCHLDSAYNPFRQ